MPDIPAGTPRPALLFIPDISGFTRFVQATEIAHSRHIIEELLEKLIDADELGLQVSEIEGDAILFYRIGEAPTAEEFFRQVRTMFIAFHAHLRLYETQRICQCGACTSAQSLTLKIVAHYGEITLSRIREHLKLFGQDVITVHRLLKNDIPHHEYALFTSALAGRWPATAAPEWAGREEGTQEYDVGRIDHCHLPLSSLKALVPEPRIEDYSIPHVTVPIFSCEHLVDAPIDLVFDVASDLPTRLAWMEGARELELPDHRINRLGTRHRCIVDRNSPTVVTSSITRDADTIVFSETDVKKAVCIVYTFRQEPGSRTRLRMDGFVRDTFVLRMLFRVILGKKLKNRFQSSGKKLKQYCEELHRES